MTQPIRIIPYENPEGWSSVVGALKIIKNAIWHSSSTGSAKAARTVLFNCLSTIFWIAKI